jgi:putative CocE/NonD family hydrolase
LAREREHQAAYFRQHYTKCEYRIPMRDGIKLFAAVYAPKDTSRSYPILLERTPYSVGPYGEDQYPKYPWYVGPSQGFAEEGYIFVYQDVRGRFMSEGELVLMTPHVEDKTEPQDTDESSDAYDTIEWLLDNIPNHNGRVGLWGISYPGFFAAAGMIDAHPALKAVSPQAPQADWFIGDDWHRHGAFFLVDSFNFFSWFGRPRPEPTTRQEWDYPLDHGTPDGYQFFLDLGPLRNANGRYFKGDIAFWNRLVEHPNYDEFWQARNILPHLKNVAPAVMNVGGWYDYCNLYGALKVYRAVERQNPDIVNILVMGPWRHGGWRRDNGEKFGDIHFGSTTSVFYREKIELAFFNYYLKDKGDLQLPEAYMFETGANRWRTFDQWPPRETETRDLHFGADGRLSFDPPVDDGGGDTYDEYVSDPARPVPFTETVTTDTPREYMIDDQRFAARRPDVLVYQTEVLEEDLTLAGPLVANLWVSTSGTASDWVVKLIDVYPADTPDYDDTPPGMHMGGYQMMVRSEVMRGRFRNSYEHPEPFVPNEPTRVTFELLDVLHTFKPGHRIMVQIQSTWFPLVDRNPQTFVENIFLAGDEDFIKATQRVYHSQDYPTHLRVGVLASDESQAVRGN